MPPKERWRSISLGAGTPRLLIQTRFGPEGYLVQLTDLGRIWEETADREAVVQKARNGNCSFDPGADEDNYAALLKYIESALEGRPKTSIDLQSGPQGDLELNLTASLPGNLPALKWNLCLSRLSDSAVAVELVNPLLLQVNSLQSQVQQLVDEISAKDHVISKITDKYETGGNDLTAVFPGASNVKMSRKKSQRSQLAGHVKGLAEFDAATWRASLVEANGDSDLTDEQMDALLHDMSPSDAIKPSNDWWKQLGSSKSSQPAENGRKTALAASQPDESQRNGHRSRLFPQDSMEDDEFERQATPPHIADLAGKPKAGDRASPLLADSKTQYHADKSIEHDEDETEDDDEDGLDGPSARDDVHVQDRLRQHEKSTVRSIEKDNVPSATSSPRKLGVIGGRKALTPQAPAEEPSEPSPTKRKSKLGAFGGKARSKTATPEPVPTAASSGRAKPKLGAFGGKAKKTPDPTTSDDQPVKHKEPEHGRIGRVGGRSATRTASPVKNEEEVEAQTAEEDEKTEEQRADEKRERLKRELEEKAKKPVKKKRKF